jgi:hypothetical protein
MSPRDILELFLQVPNPQIRTALSGPPSSDDHPLPVAELSFDDTEADEHEDDSAGRSEALPE